ncbi:hypothetical protein, partial [Salmonella sp. gx-f7]|uniref:hypothetical protein n=1 Tax=Salmonella sp. gx-f7 TaxID=2582606 RepID=UPI001F2F9E05
REQSPSCGPSTGPDFIPFKHTNNTLESWRVSAKNYTSSKLAGEKNQLRRNSLYQLSSTSCQPTEIGVTDYETLYY